VQPDGSAVLSAGEARHAPGIATFLAELSLRAQQPAAGGLFGVKLYAGEQELFRFWLLPTGNTPASNVATVAWHHPADGWRQQELPLPAAFDPTAYHLLRLEVDGPRLALALDEPLFRWQGRLAGSPAELALYTELTSAAFAGFSATIGWEDRFMDTAATPQDNGWHGQPEAGWRLEQQQLWFMAADTAGCLRKGPLLPAYELAVNARQSGGQSSGRYGFYPAWIASSQPGPLLTIEQGETNWMIRWQEADASHSFPLPTSFDPTTYQQFRFRKENGRLLVYWEGLSIAEGTVTTQPTTVALYAGRSAVAFDLVRVTAMGSL
jgi:hypothetical protein